MYIITHKQTCSLSNSYEYDKGGRAIDGQLRYSLRSVSTSQDLWREWPVFVLFDGSSVGAVSLTGASCLRESVEQELYL